MSTNGCYEIRNQASTIVPCGTFKVSIKELKRQLKGKNVSAGPNGLQQGTSQPVATKVPKGTFHVSIKELKRQLKGKNVSAGPNGLQQGTTQPGATKVPKGTFHFLDLFGPSRDYIREFEEAAPYAAYQGKIGGEDVWTEFITDPVTDTTIQLAYVTSNGGRTAEAYCIDPDMDGHSESMHNTHCYGDGRLCTDLHGVSRTLAEKRARSVLWVTGFCQYLAGNGFQVDEV